MDIDSNRYLVSSDLPESIGIVLHKQMFVHACKYLFMKPLTRVVLLAASHSSPLVVRTSFGNQFEASLSYWKVVVSVEEEEVVVSLLTLPSIWT